MASSLQALTLLGLGLASSSEHVASASSEGATCPGSIEVEGYGTVALTNAYWNVPGERAGDVEVINGTVVPYMKGRTYFSVLDSCTQGDYHSQNYTGLPLLGKRLRYTTDMSGAGCGCNAALYLTSMRQSPGVSQCSDYYCDANNVCGERCAEIDLQEANLYAWHSTLHLLDDGSGIGAGYGGGGAGWNNNRDWTREDYGPGARCIDTNQPIQVEIGFPIDGNGRLTAMTTRLTQPWRSGCTELYTEVGFSYWFNGRDGIAELTAALAAGMTPIVSYWSHDNMLWLDGKGADGLGGCERDDASACPSSVKFYDFSLESLDVRLV